MIVEKENTVTDKTGEPVIERIWISGGNVCISEAFLRRTVAKAAKTAAHKRNIREMQARIRELRLELADLRTCLADVREENQQLRMECDNLADRNSLEVTPVFIWDNTSKRITIGEKGLTKTSG